MATFSELGLHPAILQSLEDLGFETPTPIQEKSIPHTLGSSQDLIAFAQTGTGKTAAFSLPVIHNIDETSRNVQALVLCPTRELCLQISRDIAAFTKHLPKVGVVAVYGGDPIYKQLKELRKGPQIVVGTPGRVADFVRKGKVDFGTVDYVVLDEADEMLNMGFKEELDEILAGTPEDKQTLLFSATMPKSVDRIAKTYMHDPVEISVASRNEGAKNVRHVYYQSHPRDRYQVLRRVVDMNADMYGIVFCRTRNDCKELVTKLSADNYAVEAIHGELNQVQREKVMDRFRKKQTKILIATDVAARGIDVKELTHVINYSLPDQLENYVHRSGRTGRAGNSGLSIALVGNRELRSIRALEKKMSTVFERGIIPTAEEVCKTQLSRLVEKVCTVDVSAHPLDAYLADLYTELEHLDREALIQRFVSLDFQRVLSFYKDAKDLNQPAGDTYRKQGHALEGDIKTLKVNLGRKDRFEVPDLFGLLNRHRKLKGAKVGKIKIQESFTLFEVDESLVSEVLVCFNKAHFKKRKVVAKVGSPIQSYGRGRARGTYSSKNKRGGNYRSNFKKKRKRY